MKTNRFLLVISLFVVANLAVANQINVPTDYSTIQGAIDNSANGDTIIIQTGTYTENIDFKGKEIVVGSLYLLNNQESFIDSVIIDGQNSGTVVKCETSETENSKLIGVTVVNGYAGDGGGIKCTNSSPVFKNIKIKDCAVTNWGGGIYVSGGSPYFEGIVLLNNTDAMMIRENATVTFNNLIFNGNTDGEILFLYHADVQMNNTRIINNQTIHTSLIGLNRGNLVFNNLLMNKNNCDGFINVHYTCNVLFNFATIYDNYSMNDFAWTNAEDSKLTFNNSIVWNNTYTSFNEYPNTITIKNTNFEGGYTGENNISIKPEFNNADSLDFSLKMSSPCIGIGDTTGMLRFDIEKLPRPYPSCTNPDIGAFENVLGTSIDKIYIYDTIPVYDTIEVFDTTFVNVFDTIPVYDSITVIFNDTIIINDTITVTDTLLIDVTFTGIPNLKDEIVKVYPNPAKEILYLDFGDLYSNLSEYKVSIINSIGTTVFTTDISQSMIEVDLLDFGSSGLYYLQIIRKPDEILDVKKIVLE